jgi:hypothetical protein
MDKQNDDIGTAADNGSLKNDSNPDNEFRNGIPTEPEIDQPNPSIATPPIPAEMPVREGL